MGPFAAEIQRVLTKHSPEGATDPAMSRFPDPRDLLVLPVPGRAGFVPGEFSDFFVLSKHDRRGGQHGYADLIQQSGGFVGKTEIKPEYALGNEATPKVLLPFLRDTALPYFGIQQASSVLSQPAATPIALDPLDWEQGYLEQTDNIQLLEKLGRQRNLARAKLLTALMPNSPAYRNTFAAMSEDQRPIAKRNITAQLVSQPKDEQDKHAAKLLNALAEREQLPLERLESTLDAMTEIIARVPNLDQAFKQFSLWNNNQLFDYLNKGTPKFESLRKDNRVPTLSRVYFLFMQVKMLEAAAQEFVAFARQDQEQLLLRLTRDASQLEQIQRTRGEAHRVLGTLAYLTGNLITTADQPTLPEFKAESPSTFNRFMERVRCIPGSGIVESDHQTRYMPRSGDIRAGAAVRAA